MAVLRGDQPAGPRSHEGCDARRSAKRFRGPGRSQRLGSACMHILPVRDEKLP